MFILSSPSSVLSGLAEFFQNLTSVAYMPVLPVVPVLPAVTACSLLVVMDEVCW